MTYEAAWNAFGHLAIKGRGGNPLTLEQRRDHHACYCYGEMARTLMAQSFALWSSRYSRYARDFGNQSEPLSLFPRRCFEILPLLGHRLEILPSITALLRGLSIVEVTADERMSFEELSKTEAFLVEFPGGMNKYSASFKLDCPMPKKRCENRG